MFFVTGNRYADLYVQNFGSWLLYLNRHFLTLHSLGLVWKETRNLEDRTMNRAKPIADAVYGVGGISTKGARNCQNRLGIRIRATGPVKPVKPNQANEFPAANRKFSTALQVACVASMHRAGAMTNRRVQSPWQPFGRPRNLVDQCPCHVHPSYEYFQCRIHKRHTKIIKQAKPLALGSRRQRILLPFLCTQRNIDRGTDVAKK